MKGSPRSEEGTTNVQTVTNVERHKQANSKSKQKKSEKSSQTTQSQIFFRNFSLSLTFPLPSSSPPPPHVRNVPQKPSPPLLLSPLQSHRKVPTHPKRHPVLPLTPDLHLSRHPSTTVVTYQEFLSREIEHHTKIPPLPCSCPPLLIPQHRRRVTHQLCPLHHIPLLTCHSPSKGGFCCCDGPQENLSGTVITQKCQANPD